eukprot:TRINITY_DN20692_c0_g1_i1.p1 TRINITY_DN20692_c0_g1~~TRINITY_DN20692_c0_g1_i1.p1  ORF type:complete len:224 (+),score=45.40 TRINITY_DN20692_c0_g1_i1:60-731(+)
MGSGALTRSARFDPWHMMKDRAAPRRSIAAPAPPMTTPAPELCREEDEAIDRAAMVEKSASYRTASTCTCTWTGSLSSTPSSLAAGDDSIDSSGAVLLPWFDAMAGACEGYDGNEEGDVQMERSLERLSEHIDNLDMEEMESSLSLRSGARSEEESDSMPRQTRLPSIEEVSEGRFGSMTSLPANLDLDKATTSPCSSIDLDNFFTREVLRSRTAPSGGLTVR